VDMLPIKPNTTSMCTVVGEEVGSKRRGMCVDLLSQRRWQVELRRLSWA
jgi:hypothetical protein